MRTLYKYAYLLILAICITITSHSQSFINVKIGPSIPLGKFIDDDLPEFDGYASTGFTVQAEGAYLPNKLLGIGLHYDYGFNPFTNDKYFDSEINSYEKGRYVIQNMMGLFVCQLYSNAELAIQGRLLPGISFITTPEVVMNLHYGNFRKNFYIFTEQKAIQLAIKIGVSFRYQISKRYFFSLSTDYYYCNARFSTEYVPKRKLQIEQLYVLFGIEYGFTK